MSRYQELVMDAVVAKVKHKVTPLLEQMSDEERDRCEKVMEICLSAVVEGLEVAAHQPTKVLYVRQPKPSAFDRVMNNITFGLWD